MTFTNADDSCNADDNCKAIEEPEGWGREGGDIGIYIYLLSEMLTAALLSLTAFDWQSRF